MAHVQISHLIPAPRLEVFDYLTDPSTLPFLLDPTIEVQVLTNESTLKRGSEVQLEMTRFHMSQSVRLRVEDVLRGSRLTYRQVEGLFAAWTHTLSFEDHGEQATMVADIIDYQLPFGLLGSLFDDLVLKSDLRKLLERRLQKCAEHFG